MSLPRDRGRRRGLASIGALALASAALGGLLGSEERFDNTAIFWIPNDPLEVDFLD